MSSLSREARSLIPQVLDLPDASKFEVFQALVDDLGEQVGEDDPMVRSVQLRNESLEVMRLVSERLNLGALEAPTARQFDAVVGDLAEDWNSRKVIRVWELWRRATEAYKGERKVDPLVRRRLRHENACGRGKRSSSDYIAGVRRWLESKPEKETARTYDAFVEQFNAKRAAIEDSEQRREAGGEYALVTAQSISKNFRLDWVRVLKVVRKEIGLAEAQEERLAELLPPVGENRLVGLATIASLLKRSYDQVNRLASEEPSFPTPVAHISGRGLRACSRAWLYEDVILFKRGLSAPDREEGELQHLFVDAKELQARLTILPDAFKSALRRQRWDLIPKPEGALVSGVYYWQRTKVNHWLKHMAKTRAIGLSLRACLGSFR
jgi:hypothetical protein